MDDEDGVVAEVGVVLDGALGFASEALDNDIHGGVIDAGGAEPGKLLTTLVDHSGIKVVQVIQLN